MPPIASIPTIQGDPYRRSSLYACEPNAALERGFLQMPDVSSLPARVRPDPPARPDPPERFLSIRDVLGRLSISRSLLYELIKDPVRPFPSPVHIGRRSVWIEREVEAFMQDVVETERGPRRN
ncbi:MAG: hypothetical protein B7X53_02490 [Hyphomonas sp. 34-62-18]|nr:MAG: hypothetical protein B7Z22_12885 [Hyphomonas sp. 32-62-5]OZB18719.1 MAG: hypothetical protein B7X53_02490 [Hyphomonas sp. 34-62-18]